MLVASVERALSVAVARNLLPAGNRYDSGGASQASNDSGVGVRILLTADPELPVRHRITVESNGLSISWCGSLAAGPHRGSGGHRDRRRLRMPLSLARIALATGMGHYTEHPGAEGGGRRVRPDVLHSFSRLLYLLPLFAKRLPKIMSYQRLPGRRQ